MKTIDQRIWDLWNQGGPFIGDTGAPHGRVTVEIDWQLSLSDPVVGNYGHGPIRWWQRDDNSQVETEVPNIETIIIDRSVDTDAASCEITLMNQWMHVNGFTSLDDEELGQPGYFSFGRGESAEAQARWGQTTNSWAEVLTPMALIRTYQGYGGKNKTVATALNDGDIYLTGVWLVDEVKIETNATITLTCRDMAKLLIDQMLFPPLVPSNLYPLHYARYIWVDKTVTTTTPELVPGGNIMVPQAMSYNASGNDVWFGFNGSDVGHPPTDSYDGSAESFWVSVGNGSPNLPYAVEWVQFQCGSDISNVWVIPYAGNYQCFISIRENGVWQGAATIDYHTAGIGRYVGDYDAAIPYVAQVGVPWESLTEIPLDRVYNAELVRFTFTNLQPTPWGPYVYRAGVREVGAELGVMSPPTTRQVTNTQTVQERDDGNYLDYSDIIKDLLLWAGWWFHEDPVTTTPAIFGNIESTGAFSNDPIDDSIFDKVSIIDAINALKQIVGYNFWVDDDGAVHFESPNVWSAGNFLDVGLHTDLIPELDEKVQLTQYSIGYTDKSLRSEIIISSSDPTQSLSDTITTRYIPPNVDQLRGMVKPAMWVNGVFLDPVEQQTMAELISLQSFLAQRQSSASCAANPAIQINDQVRIFERQTSETYIHYVRGVHTEMNLTTGTYNMTLTTHWLGDQNGVWAIDLGIPGDVQFGPFDFSYRLYAASGSVDSSHPRST